MKIKAFFDPPTFSLTYVVWAETSKDALVIDPVLDYDPLPSRTATASVDAVTDFVRSQGLKLQWVLETHAHADHLSAAQLLKKRFGLGIAIGEHITKVQETFKGVFDLAQNFPTDGSQFDRLLADGERLVVGALEVEAIATPGHTPACLTYRIDDALFTGDALFMDDYGTGRTDFPAGSAQDLYRSVHGRLYALPDTLRVFVGHDYQPDGRDVRYETTIGASKEHNPQLRASTTESEFVKFRQQRDAELDAPRLLFQSVQVNINAGRLPEAASNGIRYLRVPLNLKQATDSSGDPE